MAYPRLNRNQYDALRALLSELEDIEDISAGTGPDVYRLAGNISRDNMNLLRKLIGLDEVTE